MFDDDISWDLGDIAKVVAVGAVGLSEWLCFFLGNQQGLDSARDWMSKDGCTVVLEKGWFGIEYLTVPSQQSLKPGK